MDSLKLLIQGLILNHGYSGFFMLTALDQFLLPIPVDLFFGFGIEHGLNYEKLMLWVTGATLTGSAIAYALGKYLGHPALTWLVGRPKVEKGEMVIKKWGIWGVIAAGFTPFPFKIIAWAAGIFELPFSRFILGVLLGIVPRYFILAYAGAKFFETQFYASTNMSAVILGTIQGLTEFLPISSTGHLALMAHFLKLPIPADQMETFDIFLHGGSLLAIVLYFRRDCLHILEESWQMLKKFRLDKNSLSVRLALGTLPAIAAGLFLGDQLNNMLRGLHGIALCFIISGILYFYFARRERHSVHTEVTLKQSLWMGLSQTLAMVPAISRSGFTIGTGILLGLTRKAAARFSFLLGGVAILAANVYALMSLGAPAQLPAMDFILIGSFTSFVFSWLTIVFFLKFLERYTLRPFGVYLILAGTFIANFL